MKMLLLSLLLLQILGNSNVIMGDMICNIVDYGAIEGVDDNALANQKAISAAIKDCGKHSGSLLLFPTGNFVTAPIYFSVSDITIHLVAGATLIASDKFEYYRPGKGYEDSFDPPLQSFNKSTNKPIILLPNDTPVDQLDADGSDPGASAGGFESVINFKKGKNIRLEGLGSIDGRGLKWWEEKGNLSEKAPFLFTISHVENFVITDLTVSNSPHIFFHITTSTQVEIFNVKVQGPADAANTAAFGISSCNGVHIHDVDIEAGDDCVAVTHESTNVLIENSSFRYCHGLSLGTEIAHVTNVLFRNIKMIGVSNGLRIKSKKNKGGFIQNITWSDIEIYDSNYPITITLNENKGFNDPVVQDITYMNIFSTNSGRAGVFDCPGASVCKNFFAKNITITNYGKAFECNNIYGTFVDSDPKLCWINQ